MTTAMLAILLSGALAPAPLQVVDNLDPARYAGRYEQLLDHARGQGFDVTRLVRTIQSGQ